MSAFKYHSSIKTADYVMQKRDKNGLRHADFDSLRACTSAHYASYYVISKQICA